MIVHTMHLLELWQQLISVFGDKNGNAIKHYKTSSPRLIALLAACADVTQSSL